MNDQRAELHREQPSVTRLHPELPVHMRLRIAGQASRIACADLQHRCGRTTPALLALTAGLKVFMRALEQGQAQLLALARQADEVCAVVERGDIMEMEALRSQLLRKAARAG